jgi:hypothetical protein
MSRHQDPDADDSNARLLGELDYRRFDDSAPARITTVDGHHIRGEVAYAGELGLDNIDQLGILLTDATWDGDHVGHLGVTSLKRADEDGSNQPLCVFDPRAADSRCGIVQSMEVSRDE